MGKKFRKSLVAAVAAIALMILMVLGLSAAAKEDTKELDVLLYMIPILI